MTRSDYRMAINADLPIVTLSCILSNQTATLRRLDQSASYLRLW